VTPDDAGRLHHLGLQALQSDDVARGVELLEQAARLGANADVLTNLSVGYRRLGRTPEAEKCLRAALGLDARHPDAHNNLGNVLRDAGRLAEAEQHYRNATQLRPQFVPAMQNLGNILNDRGKLAEAEQVLRAALLIAPRDAGTFNVLGVTLHRLGRFEEAERSYRQALAIDPRLVGALSNLGSLLAERGQLAEGEKTIRSALALKPDFADAHNNLGNVLRDTRRLEEAVASHRRALELRPRYASAHNNLGNDLRDLGKPNEALEQYRAAVAIDAESAEYHSNLGNVLMEVGRPRDALASYARALELKPRLDATHSNLIFTLDLMEGSDLEQQQRARRNWHELHAAKFAAQIPPHHNRPDPGRKLRLGYVSADFRHHSAYHAFAPLIVLHDRAGFEVYCYSGVKREDDATERLKKAAGAWRSTLGMSDDALAEQIRADGIDILVDLSGHSAGNRLLVFARKPAPVQITAWGHATGTGLAAMDYFFSDRIAVPEEVRGLFAEQVIDLPCALCYEPPEYLPEIAPLPALEGKPVTYGCVNRLEKITDQVISLWGRIMNGAPAARLLVKDKNFDDAHVRERFLARLRAAGISAERVVLAGPSPHAQHLKIFAQIDVGLDPFPQGGGISTAEALWMGVPVVALMGRTPPSRYTPSILGQVGLSDWVATSEAEYVKIALDRGRELPSVAKIRAELRDRLRASPFGDLRAYTRAVEQTYRNLWRRWCERPAP
jgi:predicted O-linked N-acetylglucosamine transferase (SPINDLY family)